MPRPRDGVLNDTRHGVSMGTEGLRVHLSTSSYTYIYNYQVLVSRQVKEDLKTARKLVEMLEDVLFLPNVDIFKRQVFNLHRTPPSYGGTGWVAWSQGWVASPIPSVPYEVILNKKQKQSGCTNKRHFPFCRCLLRITLEKDLPVSRRLRFKKV